MPDEVNSIYTRQQELARMAAAKQADEAAYNKARVPHPINECSTDASCGRMSARSVLEQRCEALLREANGIRALLQALPGSMVHEAEEALWKIVIDQRR